MAKGPTEQHLNQAGTAGVIARPPLLLPVALPTTIRYAVVAREEGCRPHRACPRLRRSM